MEICFVFGQYLEFQKKILSMLVRSNDNWAEIRRTTPNLLTTQISNNNSRVSQTNRSQKITSQYLKHFPPTKTQIELNISKSIQKLRENNNKNKRQTKISGIFFQKNDNQKKRQQTNYSNIYLLMRELKTICNDIKEIFDNIKGSLQLLQVKWSSEIKNFTEKFVKDSIRSFDKISNAYSLFQRKLTDRNTEKLENIDSTQIKPHKMKRRFTISLENTKHQPITIASKMNGSQRLCKTKLGVPNLNDIPRILDQQSKEISELSTDSKKSNNKENQNKMNFQLGFINQTLDKMRNLISNK